MSDIAEIVVPITPVMQPQPGITPGGDCFACSTAAILNTFYPESPITVADAVELWRDRQGNLTNSCYFANEVLHKIRFELGREIDYFPYLPISTERSHHNLCFRPLVDEHLFVRMFECFLSAGYVALIEMSLHPKVPISEEGLISSTDHIAVMNGLREVTVDHIVNEKLIGRGWKHEVLVTCSAVGPHWIDVQKLVRLHGCARWWLIRKNIRDYHLPFLP